MIVGRICLRNRHRFKAIGDLDEGDISTKDGSEVRDKVSTSFVEGRVEVRVTFISYISVGGPDQDAASHTRNFVIGGGVGSIIGGSETEEALDPG